MIDDDQAKKIANEYLSEISIREVDGNPMTDDEMVEWACEVAAAWGVTEDEVREFGELWGEGG